MTVGRILILLLLMGIFVSMVYLSQTDKQIIIQESAKGTTDINNTTYIIEGKLIEFSDGLSEQNLDDKLVYSKIFSHKIIEDINNDTYEDAIVVLNQSIDEVEHYYIALALGYQKGHQGSNAVYLGENIAPQTEEYRGGIIIVNYIQDSVEDKNTSKAISRYFSWEENTLKEVSFTNDLINLTYPVVASYVLSPLTVVGEARGYWYFEGDFPVIVTDWDGLIIGEGIAIAQGEWMTENFVPFEANLEFNKLSISDKGYLILQKDNPSREADKDDVLEIPIFFE